MIALTHIPSPEMDAGQRTHVARTAIHFERAVAQHQDYCRLLHRSGVKVKTLEVNRDFPDSVFIEDTALVLGEVAVLASMGTESRRGEVAGIEPELRKHREVERIEWPARLEGGDVLLVGRTLLVGVSSRSNRAGISALTGVVNRHGYRVLPVPVHGCLHLKTACTALPDNSLLMNPAWLESEYLEGFDCITVPEQEPRAANVLPIGNQVCMPAAHHRTAVLLRDRGFEVAIVDLSEFAKAEGGITCLSLLINAPS
ncbi:MAG: dimethylarginine dimethylaminohydrolase family protein [Gemmataceae bacterium]